jgi:chorismate mutase
MNTQPIHTWGLPYTSSTDSPFLIAGPCAAETEEQVLASCLPLAGLGVHLLRAGIWKPRTRPNSFEGVGHIGLEWLMRASKATGLPVSVEVASTVHVEQALKAGVQVLWIGARTTVNPFLVQEIADALQGVDIPVLVKNPVNPDIDLWIGALERVHKGGITKLAAIHRGFSVTHSMPYRNKPLWEIPIELRRRLPNLPIIGDPSHICGTRALLADVAQQQLDLDFDGLMIESHCHPSTAWSDAAQQVDAVGLGTLLKGLVNRVKDVSDDTFHQQLEILRYKIDALDEELLDLLAQRMAISREIGRYKAQKNIKIFQIERWAKIFETRTSKGVTSGLSVEFIENIIQDIHKESILQQTQVMKHTN